MQEHLQCIQCRKFSKGKTLGDGKIFSPTEIFMKLWSDVNAQCWINLTAISFCGSVHLNVTFTPSIHSAVHVLRVLVRDGGVAVLAEAGENGQHAASLLPPQRLGLMEGWQLTERERKEEIWLLAITNGYIKRYITVQSCLWLFFFLLLSAANHY